MDFQVVWPCVDVVLGREERGERTLPEELCGQLVRHNPGPVLQKEALPGELESRKHTDTGCLGLFVFAHLTLCCTLGCLWSLWILKVTLVLCYFTSLVSTLQIIH